jgi:hypothetical protein
VSSRLPSSLRKLDRSDPSGGDGSYDDPGALGSVALAWITRRRPFLCEYLFGEAQRGDDLPIVDSGSVDDDYFGHVPEGRPTRPRAR